MIYVIADDLTGANDTGVQFVKNGYRTEVFIWNNEFSDAVFSDDDDVLVIDSETRELEEKAARYRLMNLLKGLHISDKNMIYKKVDSTMRGNIGAEIEEIMKYFKKDICLFSPSFPAHQRVTVDGFLLVDQKPSINGESIYRQLHQEEHSFIPAILKKQIDLPLGQIYLKDVIQGPDAILAKINELYEKGKKIIVLDSTVEKHLEDILNSGFQFQGSVLFSGSAGLAEHFPLDQNISIGKLYRNDDHSHSPVIIVAGSRNPVVGQQIHYLKNNLNLPAIRIDLVEIFANRERILEHYITKGIEVIKKGQDLLVYTDSSFNEKNDINQQLITKYDLSFRELEIGIKGILGTLTAEMIKQTNTRDLILTGGDVALGVCAALKINHMRIVAEMLPGIPLASARYENRSLRIITKAGGFGSENTLYLLIDKLKND